MYVISVAPHTISLANRGNGQQTSQIKGFWSGGVIDRVLLAGG